MWYGGSSEKQMKSDNCLPSIKSNNEKKKSVLKELYIYHMYGIYEPLFASIINIYRNCISF